MRPTRVTNAKTRDTSVTTRFVDLVTYMVRWKNGICQEAENIITKRILSEFSSMSLEEQVSQVRRLCGVTSSSCFVYRESSVQCNWTPVLQVRYWACALGEFMGEKKESNEHVINVCLELALLCYLVLDMNMVFCKFVCSCSEVTSSETSSSTSQSTTVKRGVTAVSLQLRPMINGSLVSARTLHPARLLSQENHNRDTISLFRMRSLHFAVSVLLKLSSSYLDFDPEKDLALLSSVNQKFSCDICGFGRHTFLSGGEESPPTASTLLSRLVLSYRRGPLERLTSLKIKKRSAFRATDGSIWKDDTVDVTTDAQVSILPEDNTKEQFGKWRKEMDNELICPKDKDRELIVGNGKGGYKHKRPQDESSKRVTPNKKRRTKIDKEDPGSPASDVEGTESSCDTGESQDSVGVRDKSVSSSCPEDVDELELTTEETGEAGTAEHTSVGARTTLDAIVGPKEVKYPLYGVIDEVAAEKLTADDFLPMFDYAREKICNRYFEFIAEKFKNKAFKCVDPNIVNGDAKVTQFQYKPMKEEDVVCQVINIQQALTRETTKQMIAGFDKLSFLGSSKDVGNSQVSKMRALRAAMREDAEPEGSAFLISNDFIATTVAEGPELIVLDIVCELMQDFDQIMEDEYGHRKKLIAKWCPEKAVIHTTVGTDDGSPYALHQDSKCGMNHSHQTYDLIDDPEQRRFLLTLPSQMLIRVVNIVFHTNCDGTETAQIIFESYNKDEYQPTDPKLHQYKTESCTISVMLNTVQWFLMHRVIKLPTASRAQINKLQIPQAQPFMRSEGSLSSPVPSLPTEHSAKAQASRIMTTTRQTYCGKKEEAALFEQDARSHGKGAAFMTKKNDYVCDRAVTAMFNNYSNLPLKQCPTLVPMSTTSPEWQKVPNVTHESSVPLFSAKEYLLRINRDGVGNVGFWRSICKGLMKKEPKLDASFLSREGYRTIEDPYHLWERLTGAEMVRYFHEQKIELVLEYQKKDQVFFGRYGRPPKTTVVTNWPDDWNTVSGKFIPEEEIRRLRPGDIVNEKTIRSLYQIPGSNRTNPPWKTVHPSVSDVLILKQEYKNNHSLLKQLFHDLRRGVSIEPLDTRYSDLWAALNGGSGMENGTYAVALKKRNQENLPSSLTLPSWQRDEGVKHSTFRSMERRRSTAALFSKPPGAPKEKMDKKEYLHYCGQFTPIRLVTETEENEDILDTFVSSLDLRQWLFCSYLLGSHTKGYINKAYEEIHTGDEDGWRTIRMRIGDLNSMYRLKFTIDVSHGRESSWVNIKRFQRRTIAELIQQDIIPGLLGDEDNVTNVLEEKRFFGKNTQILNDEAPVTVTLQAFLNAIVRCSVAGAMRFNRKNTVTHNKVEYVRYLMDDDGYERYLGLILRTTPMPMPIRTYDKTTCMLFFQALESLENKFRPNKKELSLGRMIARPSISTLTEEEIHMILLTCLVICSTGNCEPIRDYFTFREMGGQEKTHKSHFRLFTEDDITALTAFMCHHCSVTNDVEEDMEDGSTMSTWVNPQYKDSVPECAKACPKTLKHFLLVSSRRLKEISQSIKKNKMKRSEVRVDIYNGIVAAITKMPKCQRGLKFFGHQVLLHFEELVSGDHGSWTYPFDDPEGDREKAILGYGSTGGVSVYCPGIPVTIERGNQSDRGTFRCFRFDVKGKEIQKMKFIDSYIENETNQFSSKEAVKILSSWHVGGDNIDHIFENSLAVVQHVHPELKDLLPNSELQPMPGDIVHSFAYGEGENIEETHESWNNQCNIETCDAMPSSFHEFEEEILEHSDVCYNRTVSFFFVRGITTYPRIHRKHLQDVQSPCSSVGYERYFHLHREGYDDISTREKMRMWRAWLNSGCEQRQTWFSSHGMSGEDRTVTGDIKEKSDGGRDKEKLTLEELFNIASEEILTYMKESMDETLLGCLGLQKIECDGKTTVVVILNGREVHRFDVEHMFCKVNGMVDRARGGRSLSVPNPFAVHCWPCKRTDTYSNVQLTRAMGNICKSFEDAIERGLLGELESPFTFITSDSSKH